MAGPWPASSYLVAACALVDADHRVLLCRRPAGKPMAGLWEFPGGKIGPGETPEACVIRELREELGSTSRRAAWRPDLRLALLPRVPPADAALRLPGLGGPARGARGPGAQMAAPARDGGPGRCRRPTARWSPSCAIFYSLPAWRRRRLVWPEHREGQGHGFLLFAPGRGGGRALAHSWRPAWCRRSAPGSCEVEAAAGPPSDDPGPSRPSEGRGQRNLSCPGCATMSPARVFLTSSTRRSPRSWAGSTGPRRSSTARRRTPATWSSSTCSRRRSSAPDVLVPLLDGRTAPASL